MSLFVPVDIDNDLSERIAQANTLGRENLNAKGVTTDGTETTYQLMSKIADIQSGGSANVSSVIIPPVYNELGLLGKSVGLVLGNEYTVVIDILENDGTTRQETETVTAYQTVIEGLGEVEDSVALGIYEDDYYDYTLYDFCNVSDEGVPVFDANECVYQTGGKVTQITITGEFAEKPDTRLKDIVEGNLTEIVDDTITEIGSYVFFRNKKITKLDLPNCTVVRSYGLNEAEITTINMPKLETIEVNGMNSCKVTEVNFPLLTSGSLGSCSALTKAVLGVIPTVSASGFYNCSKLAYCDLGTKVTSIGSQAFYKTSQLATLIIRNTSVVPTIQSNTFTSSAIASGTGYVYVPDNLVESYKTADVWSTYANQIKPLSELGGEI